jgi:hypothetical protein
MEEIMEHEYCIESEVTIILNSYIIATNKKEAEEEAVMGIQEEYGGIEVKVKKIKIRERNVSSRGIKE